MYRHQHFEGDCCLYHQGTPRLYTKLHDVISQKNGIFVNTTVRTADLTSILNSSDFLSLYSGAITHRK